MQMTRCEKSEISIYDFDVCEVGKEKTFAVRCFGYGVMLPTFETTELQPLFKPRGRVKDAKCSLVASFRIRFRCALDAVSRERHRIQHAYASSIKV